MTWFDQWFAQQGASLLGWAHGEEFIYRPKRGRPRRVEAVWIKRQAPRPMEDVPRANAPLVTIAVLNDDDRGIGAFQIDTGGDQVELELRVGDRKGLLTVVRVVDTASGLLVFEAR